MTQTIGGAVLEVARIDIEVWGVQLAEPLEMTHS